MTKRDGGIEVTDESFGALLVEGLTEARAIAGGDARPARRVRRPLTVRAAEVAPPDAFAAAAIRTIRERMGLSQALFAKVLNASVETVKAWEQGKRQPDGTALALLQVADRHPGVLMERVSDKGEPSTTSARGRPAGTTSSRS